MPLPILPSTTDLRTVTERVNPLIKYYNRTPIAAQTSADTFPPIYALDTGSATAYALAPVPGIEQYVAGQPIIFKAANANSGTAPTLNVNSLGAGTITYPDGSALVAGDIPANGFVEVIVASTTPTFHLQTPRASVPINNSGSTTFLGADVALNNVANFFSGPNTGSIGASGQVWQITAVATLDDTAGAAAVELAIFDGSVYIANSVTTIPFASGRSMGAVTVVVTLSAATTFTLRAKDLNSASGFIRTTSNATGVANKATSITAVRLA